ncbi:efflux RND transporter permease subunit [Agromyces sp. SYSU K20354]|uniref:efflux RND transporter permease subunit n=1 Tax=Agromyces cavernae TaxID=2898659 RepID=UPI001E65B04F|nr:efflux RND transporter permease subunit [Agromyces cavernae]MCD2442925.1 efflux RND transporter permease subunit [Agromyces cavernae]
MISWLVRWSLRFRLLVAAVAAGVLGFGLVSLPTMAVDNLPEFAPPHVEIQTEALGLSAEEVEQLITSPMEADLLNGVAWLDEIRSVSVPSLSSIELVFEPGTDLLRARQLVAERLTQAHALPNVSAPPVLMQPLSSTSRVMMIELTSEDVSLIDMSVLARWTVKPVLMGVPGVANVSTWGQREQQVQVQVEPERLDAAGVTLDDVITTAGNAVWVSPLSFLEASTPGTGGFIESANQRIGIQHVLPIQTPEDLGKVVIEGNPEKLTLADVADLKEDHQPLIGDAITGDAPGLLIVIEKFPEADVVEVTRGIEAAMADLAPGLAGIEVDTTVFQPATFLETAVSQLGWAALAGLLLAALVIGLGLGSWRYALIAALAMLVSGTAAALTLQLTGTVMNTMTLVGLALALTVAIGDVVADLESLRTRGAFARSRGDAAESAPDSAPDSSPESSTDAAARRTGILTTALRRSRLPALFGALVSAVAIAPSFFVPGLDGEILRAVAIAYLVTLLVAMIVALTVTPALASLLLRRKDDTEAAREPAAVTGMTTKFSGAMERASAGRGGWIGALVAVVLGVLALGTIPLTTTDAPVLASVPDRTILVEWNSVAGTSNDEMSRITARAADELRTLAGVAAVGGHVGRAITSDTESDVSGSEMWVTLEDGADYAAVKEDVQQVIDGYPGLANRVMSYPERQVERVRAAQERDFQVRVYGIDIDILREKAAELQAAMAGIDGLVEPTIQQDLVQPITEIEVDLEKAKQFGVKPGDVRRAAAAVLQGFEVGYMFEEQKVFQVVVKGTEDTRHSLTSVEDLIINTPGGDTVALSEVADVRISPNLAVIRHDDTHRRINITADVQGRSLADVEADVRAAIADVEFPVEYHAEIPKQYGEQQASGQLTWWLLAAAAVVILVLLQTVLGSWRLGAIALLTLPLALAGGLIGAWLAGGLDSLVLIIALVPVLAFAVREAGMLIGAYQTAVAGRQAESPAKAMWAAAGARIRPALVALAASVALLAPPAFFGGTVGVETVLPVAAVIWGGTVTSILVSLIVLPLLVLAWGGTRAADSSLVNLNAPVAEWRQEPS